MLYREAWAPYLGLVHPNAKLAMSLNPTVGRSIPDAGSMSPCSGHEVQFYFDDRYLIGSLAEFFRKALVEGRSTVVVATKAHREALAQELVRFGVPLDSVLGQGRYLALDAAETLAQFMVDGQPDENLFREVVGDVIECAATASADEATNVAVFGEMVVLLWQKGEPEAALRLEQFWNRLSDSHSFQLRCA